MADETSIRNSPWIKIVVNLARASKDEIGQGQVFAWCKENHILRLEFIFIEQIVFGGDKSLWGAFLNSDAASLFLREIRPSLAVLVLKYTEQIENQLSPNKKKTKKEVKRETKSMTYAMWPRSPGKE